LIGRNELLLKIAEKLERGQKKGVEGPHGGALRGNISF